MASGRKKRTHYSFILGSEVRRIETSHLLRYAQMHAEYATAACLDGDRAKTLARLAAVLEVLQEARNRGEQLRLRM